MILAQGARYNEGSVVFVHILSDLRNHTMPAAILFGQNHLCELDSNLFKNLQHQLLFPLQYDHQTHNPKEDRLEPRMLTEHNSHISHHRHIPPHAANNILLTM